MPNDINPENYNVDKLSTGFLGPILTTDFRDWVLGHNLQDINPEVASHGYNLGGLNVYAGDLHLPNENIQDLPNLITISNTQNAFTNSLSPISNSQFMNLWSNQNPYSYIIGSNIIQTYPSSSQNELHSVGSTLPLSDPGDTLSWTKYDGTNETAKSLRYGMINSRPELKKNNKNWYGPDILFDYTNPNGSAEKTSYVQYKTFAGGDFRSTILGRQLGFSPVAGIEYTSDLSDIGVEQRKFNLQERIKFNFLSDTLGHINADPFGLLIGQDLITRDYTITQPPGFIGKAAQFTANLAGFNLPTSVIPTWLSVPGNNGTDMSQDLLKYTGNGTKTLLFDAIEKNKWGPSFVGGEKSSKEKSKIGKFIEKVGSVLNNTIGAGTPPATITYIDNITKVKGDDRVKPLVEKLNDGVTNLINGLINKQEEPTLPKESTDPSVPTNPIDGNEAYGFNTGYDIINQSISDEYTSIDDWGINPKRFITKGDSNGKAGDGLISDSDTFFWEKKSNPFKRGLLSYTQKLVNMDGEHGGKYIGVTNTDKNISTNKKNRHIEFSQGNRIQDSDSEGKIYCRSWSIRNPYTKYEDTIRHESLRRESVFKNLSVLEDNGMPKIVPYINEYNSWKNSLNNDGNGVSSPSKYMLSIENLAWQNTREFNLLPNVEKGPHGGRIMWFPPYDINFTDNSSVSWESTQFIGRGEPIYTYNSTERTGSLDFTIITDHASALNLDEIRNNVKFTLEQYFAGCGDLTNTLFGDVIGDEESITQNGTDTPKPIDPPTATPPTLTFYFQNADTVGEFQPGRNVYTDIDADYTGTPTTQVNTSFQADLQSMIDFLLSSDGVGKRYKIISEGFTSALNVSSYNQVLGKDRATSLRTYLTDKLVEAETGSDAVPYESFSEGDGKTYPKEINWINDTLRWAGPVSRGETPDSGQDAPVAGGTTPEEKEILINNPKAIKGRRATIRLEYNPDIDALMLEKSSTTTEDINKKKTANLKRTQETISSFSEKKAKEMVNEATYFNKLKVEDPFIYESIKEKIQFFHPAFHSMTPEGMNSRLTFLKQCTRQGPNISRNEPQNMAFGKPPICVLRIGDFYHTKIVIDTVNFSYEPLLWDLNPEGIGVQPMITKVSMGFKFIGGSSLGGPINQLQNAVSFNFFANTSVYNKRKDVVLTTDKRNSRGEKTGTKEELFGYGSFITPEQENNDKVDNGSLQHIDLTTKDVIVPEDVPTEKAVPNITDTEKDTINEGYNPISSNEGYIKLAGGFVTPGLE